VSCSRGSASGGVWKTLDGGLTWYPTTDGLPNLAVGAVAWAPSNPDIAYAGTGEGDTLIAGGSGYIPGLGLLRSDDGGETWIIPDASEEPYAELFFHIDVDPADPNTLLAATEQGVIRSVNGGASWETVLSSASNNSLAYVEVSRSAQDPNLLYAAQWCEGASCPAGTDRVMKSMDRGLTWMPTANTGLPGLDGYTNRPGFAMSPSDDQILYIAMNTDEGTQQADPTSAIFRSDDGGETWTLTGNTTPYLGYQGWYDNTITVHPTDPDIVVAGGVYYVRTENAGATWIVRNPYQSGGGMGSATLPHVDGHDLQWQGETLWLGCDGGVWFSEDNGQTWTGRNDGVVTRQYYGIAVDPINREVVLGGTQDNGTDRRRMADDDTFDNVLGGDGFECAINPMLPDIQYATIYNTSVFRTMPPSRSFSFISPAFTENAPFITPLTLHPARPQTVFTGTTMLWRSDNNGNSWFSLPYDTFNDIEKRRVVLDQPGVGHRSERLGSGSHRGLQGRHGPEQRRRRSHLGDGHRPPHRHQSGHLTPRPGSGDRRTHGVCQRHLRNHAIHRRWTHLRALGERPSVPQHPGHPLRPHGPRRGVRRNRHRPVSLRRCRRHLESG
jgi:photosystem II stability/assembly factor-like uncharacterized protein